MIYHTEPRYTKDLDLLVATDEQNAMLVKEILVEFGAPVGTTDITFFMDKESFLIIGFPPNKVDILMSIPGVDFKSSYDRSDRMEIDGLMLPVINLDDLVSAKQAAGRPQDLIDAENLLVAVRLRDQDSSS